MAVEERSDICRDEEEFVIVDDLAEFNPGVEEEVIIEEQPKKRRGRPLREKKLCPYGCRMMIFPENIEHHRKKGCNTNSSIERVKEDEKLGLNKNFCCGLCGTEFVTRVNFYKHLSEAHQVNPSVHFLSFPNKETFMRFINWLEVNGGAHFREKTKMGKESKHMKIKRINMACNRSDYFDTGNTKKMGNFRNRFTCTAFINGTEQNDGSINIEFCGDHYAHDIRMRLPNIVKQIIAQQQMDGVNDSEIIEYLRRQFGPLSAQNIYAKRVCQVECEELRTLMATTTKKWEDGIPVECEIWEEELLELAGIEREGAPKIKQEGDLSTEGMAEFYKWPKPQIFYQTTAVTLEDPVRIEEIKVFQERESRPRIVDPTVVKNIPSPKKRRLSDRTMISEFPLTRNRVIDAMESEINELIEMVRQDSGAASSTYMIAFLTRIRQLKLSFINGKQPNRQPLSEQMTLRKNGLRGGLSIKEEKLFNDLQHLLGCEETAADQLVYQDLSRRFKKFNPDFWT